MTSAATFAPKDVIEAEVLRHGVRIGTLSRTTHGSRFDYDPGFLAASPSDGGAALHLPYAQRSFETRGVNLHSYFAGLLPEGLRLDALVRQVKTSEDDLFSLLVAIGEDTVGDLSVHVPGAPSRKASPPQTLSEVSFTELFAESIGGAGEPLHEASIPGVQEKVSGSMVSFPVTLASRRESHILKLNPPDRPRLVENEAFFMEMARDCGLEAARVRLVHDREGALGLLVTRFDRRWSKERKGLVGLHQEDGCQFLDRYPADKYRLTCNELAEGLEVCAAPVPERARFLQLVAFSYLIGNGDLHAKNVSVTALLPDGGLRLSPAYHLLSTLPYGDRRMALKLDGRDDAFEGRYLIAFGERYGVRAAATRKMLETLVGRAKPWFDRVGEIGLEPKKTRELERTMRERAEELLRFDAPAKPRKR